MEHPHRATLDNMYAGPQNESAQTSASAARLRSRAIKLLLASVVGFAASVGVGVGLAGRTATAVLFSAVALIAAIGAGHGVAALLKGAGAPLHVVSVLGVTLLNVAMSCVGAFAAYLSTLTFTRGRQIRIFGKIALPPVVADPRWARRDIDTSSVDIDDRETRRALAVQWRENGRSEHASVAAFARLTLDLMALGAPPVLVADCQRDALDEIRHAELCFGLACSLDGRSESPGPFPQAARARTLSRHRTLALGQLAVDSLVDGALHEGVSARIIAKLARRCAVPPIQLILKEIAADEGRHARHGWDVVLWCLAEGGEPVAHALEGAMKAMPRVMTSSMPDEARNGGWERFGIMGETLEAEELAGARAHVERRLSEAIAASRVLCQASATPSVSVG